MRSLLMLLALTAAGASASATSAVQDAPPVVSVRSVDGAYVVDARFEIAAPPGC